MPDLAVAALLCLAAFLALYGFAVITIDWFGWDTVDEEAEFDAAMEQVPDLFDFNFKYH